MRQHLKSIVEHIPYGIGHWLACVPFSWRLGRTYGRMRTECAALECADDGANERYAVEHFRKVFEYAREKFPCYRELYKSAGVLGLKIRSLDDIAKVPTIDKSWCRCHTDEFSGAYRLCTGGTTGSPMWFWMDKACWAREWAHMHTIWETLGYSYRDLKATLRGKNMGNRPFEYNPVHNEYRLNTYLPIEKWKDELLGLFDRRKIKYIHPFPSSLHEFFLNLERVCTSDEIQKVLGGIRGLLLSSEFPAPHMVAKYQEYSLPYVSWYGHSEMCVLAYDSSGRNGGAFANRYHPFVSYGLAEETDGHLIGTSYHNFAMPLIRYDTGDLVEATRKTADGLLQEFAVKEGRANDYIVDKNGKRVSLTALLYGRNHKIFEYATSVQIGQKKEGKAVVHVCLPDGEECDSQNIPLMFDFSGVDIDFEYVRDSQPTRTKAGKVRLKIEG